MQEVELVVQGEVQGVGYRQYVAKIGRKLKLAGCVKNLEDGTVQILCKGDQKTISEFKKKIERKNPPEAPLIDVEEIKEMELEKGMVKQTTFIEIYDDLNAEMSQGFSTGMNYLNLSRGENKVNFGRLTTEVNLLRTETKASFEHMDEKYDAISRAMLAVVDSIEDRNKTFENRIEKTEKNIESLLKILAEKKS